jgi:hypothetical protein
MWKEFDPDENARPAGFAMPASVASIARRCLTKVVLSWARVELPTNKKKEISPTRISDKVKEFFGELAKHIYMPPILR